MAQAEEQTVMKGTSDENEAFAGNEEQRELGGWIGTKFEKQGGLENFLNRKIFLHI